MALSKTQIRILNALDKSSPVWDRLTQEGGEDFGDLMERLALAFDEVISIDMDDAADVTGGGTTRTVGFQLRNSKGDTVLESRIVEYAAFDEAGLVTPATNGTLASAGLGTILAGSGTNALKVQTDAQGRFTCTLTDIVDESVFLACGPSFGSPLMDCRETDSVAFSA